MSQRDVEDGRTGQPFRSGGNLNDWIIGDSLRKHNEYMTRANAAPPSIPSPWSDPPALASGGWSGAPSPTSSGDWEGFPGRDFTPPTVTGVELRGCLFSLIALVAGPVFWPILYPFSVAAAFAGAVGSAALVYRFAPNPLDPRLGLLWLVPLLVLLVSLVIASRIDHKLAPNLGYRIARHIARLALVGALTWYMVGDKSNPLRTGTSLLDLLRHAAAEPVRLALAVGAVVGVHFLLWNARSLRSKWHEHLEAFRLRSS